MNILNINNVTLTNNINRNIIIANNDLDKKSEQIKTNKPDQIDISKNAKMTSQLNQLVFALKDMDEANSFLKTADKKLSEIEKKIQTIHMLAEKSAKNKSSDSERINMQTMVEKLADEINNIVSMARYKDIRFLSGELSMYNPRTSIWVQTGHESNDMKRIFIRTMFSNGLGLMDGTGRLKFSISKKEDAHLSLNVSKSALEKVDQQRSNLKKYRILFDQESKNSIKEIKTILQNNELKADQKEIQNLIKNIENKMSNPN